MKNKNSLLAFIQKNKWYFIAAMWVIGLLLGYIGFGQYAQTSGETYTWADKIFGTIQLVFLEYGAGPTPPLPLNIARFLLPLLTAQTGLMALAGIFTREFRQFNLRFSSRHIIVCGDGDLASFATRAVQKSGKRVALITASQAENEIRSLEELGVVVLEGTLSDPEIASKAALNRAGYLLSFYDDDNRNIENALLVDEMALKHKKGALQCITHLHDPLLGDLFLEQMLKTEWKHTIQHDISNIYEQGARLVLEQYPAASTSEPEKPVTILIIGFGKFGQHILLESIRKLAANTRPADFNFHILDREADWKCTAIKKRYPQLDQVCCITAHELDIFSSEFQDTGHFFAENCPDVERVYVCLNDDLQAISTALSIYRQFEETSPRIILRLSQANGVKDLFQYVEKIEKIGVVPLFDEIGTPEVLLNSSVEQLARAFHQHYLQEREANGASGPAVVVWKMLAEDKKESNRSLARYLKKHLSQMNYQLIPQQGLTTAPFSFSKEEVDFLARLEHERWAAEQSAKGWRYGLVNDPRKKTNPDMQSWEQLSDAEKSFNREFIRILPQLVTDVRLQITRRAQKNEPK